jgi:glycosyltransferase involved in cell wall biosynthesis
VHTFHGHLLHGYFNPRTTRAVVELERILAKRSDVLVSVGEAVRDELIAAGVGHLQQYRVIYPGVRFPELLPKAEARRRLGIPLDVVVVAFIGRLARIKRPDRMIDVAALLHASQPEVRFIVAGDGDLRASLQHRIDKDDLPVTLLGWRTDIGTILSACDAVLMTSDNEGTPLVLIEAEMAGIPVVSTRVGSVSEIVDHGRTGFVTGRDAREIQEALQELTGNAPLRSQMGSSAAVWAGERFGLNRFVAAQAQLLRSAVAARAFR